MGRRIGQQHVHQGLGHALGWSPPAWPPPWRCSSTSRRAPVGPGARGGRIRLDRQGQAVPLRHRGGGAADGLGKMVTGGHVAARIRPGELNPQLDAERGGWPRVVGPGGERPSCPGCRSSRPPALVAQRIEHRPPEPCAQVRVLPRAPSKTDRGERETAGTGDTKPPRPQARKAAPVTRRTPGRPDGRDTGNREGRGTGAAGRRQGKEAHRRRERGRDARGPEGRT